MRLMATALFCAMLAAAAPEASAQPDGRFCEPPGGGRLTRLVVPFAPGGAVDLIARTMEHVVVENRPGAGGAVGAATVAKADSNEAVLLLTSVYGIAYPNFLHRNLPFDALKDFVPVSLVAEIPMFVAVNAELPTRNMRELIDYAKQHPGKVNQATTSAGSVDDLTGALLSSLTGVDITRVPYRGTGPAVAGLVAGDTRMSILPMTSFRQQARNGRLRTLAVLSRNRSRIDPDVPTAQEAGISGFEVSNWVGLFAPSGTPRERIACYRASSTEYMKKAEVRAQLEKAGIEVASQDPDRFPAYVKSEVERWARVAKTAGIRAE